MVEQSQMLKDLAPSKDFFVGIDSDGCVFDSMEIKHKECFCPMFVKYWDLQAVSRLAREVWEFVNLYSRTRGINRWPALTTSLDLLRARPQTAARGVTPSKTPALRAWIESETKLGNAPLKARVDAAGDRELAHALAWSEAVNAQVADIVHGLPPWPG